MPSSVESEHSSALPAAALVLGILGMIACPGLGPLAVLAGAIALRRRRGSRGDSGRGFALAGLLCGCAGTLMIPVVLSMFFQWRELSRRALCAQNFREIELALLIYSSEQTEQGIPTLDDLVRTGALPVSRSVCPSAHLGIAHYVVKSLPDDEIVGARVIAYEPIENHSQGGHVLFGDSRLRFVSPTELPTLISHDGVPVGWEARP
jgi:hypothetical protein